MQSGKIQLNALSKGHYPGVKLGAQQLPGITSLGFWNSATTQNWGLEPHRNEGVEITFLETGRMAFSVEANDFELRSGNFTITRPWQLHKLGNPNLGPGRLHWLILDVGVRRPNQDWRWPRWLTMTEPDRAALTRKLRHNENPVWDASPEIAAAFRNLAANLVRWGEPQIESRLLCLLNQLLLDILAALTRQQTFENPKLTSRRRTVELFLRDLAENAGSSSQPWTVERMAAQSGMGITAFSQHCRQLVNNGPVEYLNKCRLAHAARQLREQPDLPVTEIALRHGFNSGQYFATAFRKQFQMTPGSFRQQSRRDAAAPPV